MTEFNFNVNKVEGRSVNRLWDHLRIKEAEMLAEEQYKKFGNRKQFPEMFKANAECGHGFTEYHLDGNNRNAKKNCRRKYGAAKEKALKKLGRAKGQKHMEDFQ